MIHTGTRFTHQKLIGANLLIFVYFDEENYKSRLGTLQDHG